MTSTPATVQAQTARMLKDPAMTGDLLLFGITLTNYILWKQTRSAAERLAETRMFWGDVIETWTGQRKDWVKHIVADDIPRYEETRSDTYTCAAPMIRRDGLCGTDARLGLVRVYQIDGQVTLQRACPRHEGWGKEISRKTKAAWEDAGSPEPPNNTGGNLQRYFRGNWNYWYWRANPRLMEKMGHEMPESIRAEIGREPDQSKAPVFQLIAGGRL